MRLFVAGLSIILTLLMPEPALASDKLYQPHSDDEVILEVPDHLVVRPKAAEAGRSGESAGIGLIAEILQRARQTGDPRLYGQAQAWMGAAWQNPSLNGPMLLHRANIRQFNHMFDAAAGDLERYLEQSPSDLNALLMLNSIHLVRGRFAEARSACETVQSINEILATICSSAVDSLVGRSAGAIANLTRIEKVLRIRGNDALPYLYQTLGDAYARSGELAFAQQSYEKGLRHAPNDRFILAALADTLWQLGKYQDMVRILQGAGEFDSLLVRLAMAQARLNEAATDPLRERVAARLSSQGNRTEAKHGREIAMFQLYVEGQPRLALESARTNFELQREPIDVQIYIDSALAAKSQTDLDVIKRWFGASGFVDHRLTERMRRDQL